MSFTLHPQLAKDSILLGHFPLSQLRLINDAQYPWLILVPEREGLTEIIDLPVAEQRQLWEESALLSQALRDAFKPDKLNLAAIGNMVPQLHFHHIARFEADPCWPKPVWGQRPAVPYQPSQAEEICARLKAQLAEQVRWAS